MGCGTGALSVAVLATARPARILGIDSAAAHVAWSARRLTDVRAHFRVGDASDLPAGEADVVVSGLVPNFLPDPAVALAAMRKAAPDGLIAAYVWDYAGGMGLIHTFWEAAVALDPGAAAHDEGRRFPLCRPAALSALWRRAGLTEVRTAAIEVPTQFRDFDDYWLPFLGGQGPAPGYVMSLDESHREALRDLLRSRLPVAADGTISLGARAWAVAGQSRSPN